MPKTFEFLAGSLALENRPYHFQIVSVIRSALEHCHGYFGYKLTTLGRATDDDVPSFLIVTQEHGVVLIDVVEDRIKDIFTSTDVEYWRNVNDEVTLSRGFIMDIYNEEVQSRLKNDLSLYDRKTKKVRTPIKSAVVFCSNESTEIDRFVPNDIYDIATLTADTLGEWLRDIPTEYNCSKPELDKLCSLLEGTFIYETKSSLVKEDALVSVNDYIQRSLQTTFKQDDSQRLASMQLPPGPQRIRGLAGTGKTIVLCLKAAISHKRFKEFKILYLFNTQSLYSHVQNLISKYYTLEAKRPPDFDDHLHVFHAWGGRQKPGLYSTLCKTYGLLPLTLGDVRGRGDSLAHIYRDLLEKLGDSLVPEYDLVLIDEAQDFPREVFEVVYRITKGEGESKRIIWAYDEFQSLRDTEIKGPSELFGKKEDGSPNLPDAVLNGKYPGDIPKDFVLPNCYRTPRPILMTAHGVAMGLYTNSPTEMFYNPADWAAIGYQVKEPQELFILEGQHVQIERPDENSKNLLESLLLENSKQPLNLVQCETTDNPDAQLEFIAQEVLRLTTTQGVSPEEIIIVNLKSGNNKESMLTIQRSLNKVGVRSVIPGYVESADIFKPKGSVTITTPFRAKGNEANIVFVMNAQSVVGDFTLRMRNAFFVAVTRSRGWCYITGHGDRMSKLCDEINAMKKDFPRFIFQCPSKDSVKRSKSFLSKSDKELDQIQDLMELLDKNPELLQLIADRNKSK